MASIPYHASFSPAQYASIRRGLVPDVMEDKWFIFSEDGILYLHRRWTGHCVYRVHFESMRDAYEVSKAFVAADKQHYRRAHDDYEVRLVDFLIRALLLHERLEFPFPPWIGRRGKLPYQFIVAGNVPTLEEKPGALMRIWRTLQRSWSGFFSGGT